VICGGEALPQDLSEELLRRGATLWNGYGPTETTIYSTMHRIERAEAVAADERVVAGDDGPYNRKPEVGDVWRREVAEQRAVTRRRDSRAELAEVVREVVGAHQGLGVHRAEPGL
jgi:hypothetical protein